MLKLFNTLSRKKETFRPIKKGSVGLYTCGPTVYDSAHIGNLRTYIFEDILRRVLKQNGYKVKQVMNITDIEDKIFKRLKKEKKKSIFEITKPYTKLFLEDIKKLNIEKAEAYPTVTGHIEEIVNLIERLMKKGFAYKGKDGSVYFDISKFRNYGRLAGLRKVDLKHGARVTSDEYSKEGVGDFVLWKAKKPGEPSWKSPFGEGRPGWHIECSAIGMKHLGNHFDIHTGGVDNIFPHHDNEIAQSESATGKKFVNYWIHGEHLLVNGRKMAKSAKNFYTLSDIEKKGFDPLAFRYFVLNANYRSRLNFTWDSLAAAETGLYNLYHEVALLKHVSLGKRAGVIARKVAKGYEKKFLQAVSDDLNTPRAMSIVWDVVHEKVIPPEGRRNLLFGFDKVLALNLKGADTLAKPPVKVKDLVFRREKFRINKQFTQADALRKKAEALGYIIEDTPKGPFVWPRRI